MNKMYNYRIKKEKNNMNDKEITLKNGMIIPSIGFGTCKHNIEESIDNIIKDALDMGYRYFDTASYYATERDIGRSLKASGLKRSEYYVATKLWYEELGYDNAKKACQNSLERLDTDYIDIYFIHWPKQSMEDSNWKEKIKETWQAMIELKKEGKVKALAVSNFLPHHLQVIIDNFDELPVIDQLELHLGYQQEYALNFIKEHNIQPQAWSPLGRGMKDLSSNKAICEMAKKYNVSIQKLGLRFLTQRGIMPIVWSTSKEHMIENLNPFDFEIKDEDMSMLICMPQVGWLGEHPDFFLPLGKHLNPNQ